MSTRGILKVREKCFGVSLPSFLFVIPLDSWESDILLPFSGHSPKTGALLFIQEAALKSCSGEWPKGFEGTWGCSASAKSSVMESQLRLIIPAQTAYLVYTPLVCICIPQRGPEATGVTIHI